MPELCSAQLTQAEDAGWHSPPGAMSSKAMAPRSFALGLSLALHAGAFALLFVLGETVLTPPHVDAGERLVVATFHAAERPPQAAPVHPAATPIARPVPASPAVSRAVPLAREGSSTPPANVAAPPSIPKERAAPADTPASASPPMAVGASPSRISAYVAQLWHRIEARRPAGNGLRGTVVVLFRLDREGRLLALSVARSSNIATLDRLGLRAVQGSAPFPAPPQDFSEDQLTFSVPVNFL